MQLETAKILSRGRIRRTAEEGRERPDVADIVGARLLDEVAHGHVLDHAPAQRADGLLAHRGAPVLRWRLLTPQSSRRDAQLVTASRSPGHCIGATGSVLRAQRTPAKAGSFCDPMRKLTPTRLLIVRSPFFASTAQVWGNRNEPPARPAVQWADAA